MKKIPLLLLLILSVSCTDYEVFDEKNIPDQGEPIMSCFISPEADTTFVSLMYATSLFYHYNVYESSFINKLKFPIENATITLTDNFGKNTILQKHSAEFLYYSLNSIFPIIEGHTYFLKAKFNNDSLQASTEIPKKAYIENVTAKFDSVPIDSRITILNLSLNGVLKKISPQNILIFYKNYKNISYYNYNLFTGSESEFRYKLIDSTLNFSANYNFTHLKNDKFTLGFAVLSYSKEMIALGNKLDSIRILNYNNLGDLNQSSFHNSLDYTNIVGGKGIFGAYRLDTISITNNN
ncbi:MAG TPA: hypothetical protein DCQ31_00745 [Bacteroidales bacterium]|nr:hypothetical protein [Bacteroidales bacterium]